MSGQEHGKRDALEIENEALKAELTAVRAVLWDYWLASHDERCTENWPHAERTCYYPPPPEVFFYWTASGGSQ